MFGPFVCFLCVCLSGLFIFQIFRRNKSLKEENRALNESFTRVQRESVYVAHHVPAPPVPYSEAAERRRFLKERRRLELEERKRECDNYVALLAVQHHLLDKAENHTTSSDGGESGGAGASAGYEPYTDNSPGTTHHSSDSSTLHQSSYDCGSSDSYGGSSGSCSSSSFSDSSSSSCGSDP